MRVIEPGEIPHPGWCSPEHCRADRVGMTHESAPVEVAGLTVTVGQPATDTFTHPLLTIETDPKDNDGRVVTLRLGDVPKFTKALLAFYCQ
jgi:hypothetical protein